MPNYCSNSITVKGSVEDLEKFQRFVSTDRSQDGSSLDFEQFCPPLAKAQDFFDAFGYNWCLAFWGTKWNTHDTDVKIEDQEGLKYGLTTANSPPCEVVVQMSCMFPELLFELSYDEPCECFQGDFHCQTRHFSLQKNTQASTCDLGITRSKAL